MQLVVTAHLAALVPSLMQKLILAFILLRACNQWRLQPRIEPARLDVQAAAHRSDGKQLQILGQKRVPQFASLAKYVLAFLGCRVPRRGLPYENI